MKYRSYLLACEAYPTPAKAWENSEGWLCCQDHLDKQETPVGFWWVIVPEELHDPETGEQVGIWNGQCPTCYDEYTDNLRESCERDQVARWEAQRY